MRGAEVGEGRRFDPRGDRALFCATNRWWRCAPLTGSQLGSLRKPEPVLDEIAPGA